ncbi:hypothetical protein K438DRAFT_1785725 [Mycena galopus ATCC 62051]|nr:hypothetical protein K438DRAFT_1785725 [Mycena galopus ATCC 62051]
MATVNNPNFKIMSGMQKCKKEVKSQRLQGNTEARKGYKNNSVYRKCERRRDKTRTRKESASGMRTYEEDGGWDGKEGMFPVDAMIHPTLSFSHAHARPSSPPRSSPPAPAREDTQRSSAALRPAVPAGAGDGEACAGKKVAAEMAVGKVDRRLSRNAMTGRSAFVVFAGALGNGSWIAAVACGGQGGVFPSLGVPLFYVPAVYISCGAPSPCPYRVLGVCMGLGIRAGAGPEIHKRPRRWGTRRLLQRARVRIEDEDLRTSCLRRRGSRGGIEDGVGGGSVDGPEEYVHNASAARVLQLGEGCERPNGVVDRVDEGRRRERAASAPCMARVVDEHLERTRGRRGDVSARARGAECAFVVFAGALGHGGWIVVIARDPVGGWGLSECGSVLLYTVSCGASSTPPSCIASFILGLGVGVGLEAGAGAGPKIRIRPNARVMSSDAVSLPKTKTRERAVWRGPAASAQGRYRRGSVDGTEGTMSNAAAARVLQLGRGCGGYKGQGATTASRAYGEWMRGNEAAPNGELSGHKISILVLIFVRGSNAHRIESFGGKGDPSIAAARYTLTVLATAARRDVVAGRRSGAKASTSPAKVAATVMLHRRRKIRRDSRRTATEHKTTKLLPMKDFESPGLLYSSPQSSVSRRFMS